MPDQSKVKQLSIYLLQFPQMNRSEIIGGNVTNPSKQQQQQQSFFTQSNDQQQQSQSSGIFSTASNLLSGASNAATGSIFGNRQNHPKGPQVIPQTTSSTSQQNQFNSK